VLAFYHAIVAGQPRPKFSWSFAPDGVIEIKTAERPLAAVLWQAANPEARDFRLEAIGPAYRSSALEPVGDGTLRARVSEPTRGWVAYFVELTFPSRGPFPFKFTTQVRVAPDTLPFGLPPEMMSAAREVAEISR
jgi:PhoPQ-activated pathogenicity-related protein